MLVIHSIFISLYFRHAANALYLHRNTIQKAADIFLANLHLPTQHPQLFASHFYYTFIP